MFVVVVDKNQNPLMPTKPSRARKWIRDKKATPFWKNGVFCVRLNVDPFDRYFQEIAIGVDPGSKKEGFTVKSEAHTYLNVQADAHNKVGKQVEKRRELRRSRRSRKCPNRKNRTNGLANQERIPAGTRARWDWKLRILEWLSKLYPITHVCVEDIKARTLERARKWNQSFSPLEVGKQWFYTEVEKRWKLLPFKAGNQKRYAIDLDSRSLARSYQKRLRRTVWIVGVLHIRLSGVLIYPRIRIYSVYRQSLSADVNSTGRTHRKVTNARVTEERLGTDW